LGSGEWQIERELEGYRGGDRRDPHDRVVQTRRGRNITDQLPEFASLSAIRAELVFDGELIAGAGRSQDFYGLARSCSHGGRLSG
jgi:ATP-dependent DNA ligase